MIVSAKTEYACIAVLELAARHGEFSVYLVEVCRTCSWNHLVQSSVLGTGARPDRPRRRRSAAE